MVEIIINKINKRNAIQNVCTQVLRKKDNKTIENTEIIKMRQNLTST